MWRMSKLKLLPLAIFLLLLLPNTVCAQSPRLTRAMLWGSVAADLSSTWNAAPGYREGNPLLGQNKFRQAAVMVSLTALTDWSTTRMEHSSPAKLSKSARWIVIGVHFAAAGWNLAQSRKSSFQGR
jgi:hypothetical protein